MTSARRALTALLAVGWLAHGGTAIAQGGDKFTARLAWVPTAGADRVSGKSASPFGLFLRQPSVDRNADQNCS